MSALADLRYPRRFAEWTLAHGNILGALVCASVAMAFSTAAAYRLAATVHPEDLVFGPTRIDVVATLISGIGVFYPDKKPTQRVGIISDVVVTPTVDGIRDGRDEVLEAAVRQILGPRADRALIQKMTATHGGRTRP